MDDPTIKRVEICKYLRARNSFGRMEGGEHPWVMLDDPNMICWCILSTGSTGPDNKLVGPRLCVKGRSCYKKND